MDGSATGPKMTFFVLAMLTAYCHSLDCGTSAANSAATKPRTSILRFRPPIVRLRHLLLPFPFQRLHRRLLAALWASQ